MIVNRCILCNGSSISYGAVSYTHLDVYKRQAFTGARKSGKPGLFEMAHKGTIFLDEIGDLPLDMQGRLLRVLQEKEVMRICLLYTSRCV